MRFLNIILDWLLVRSLTVTHLNESLSHFFKRGKMGLDEQGVQKIIKGKIHGSTDGTVPWTAMERSKHVDGQNLLQVTSSKTSILRYIYQCIYLNFH